MERTQGACALRRRRPLVLTAAAAALCAASQGRTAFSTTSAIAGRSVSQARPWTGEASRARLIPMMQSGDANVMIRSEGDEVVVKDAQGRARFMVPGPPAGMGALGGDELTTMDEDAKFVALESRRKITKIFSVGRALSLLLFIFAVGVPMLSFIYAALPVAKRRNQGRRVIDHAIILWSKIAVWPFFRVSVKGKENLLPEDQAVVYVANHQSFMDILSSFHLSQSFKFVSKASILKIPLIGQAMKAANTITIEREDRRSQLNAFRKCVDTLKAGTSIFVFPEGTRSPTGALINFKKGPFSMARKAGVPIVPVTIKGTNAVMPSKKEYFLFPSKAGVEVVVHPPVSGKDVQEMDEGVLLNSVKKTIESALPKQLQTAES